MNDATNQELLDQAELRQHAEQSRSEEDESEQPATDEQASQPAPDGPDESTRPKTAPVPTGTQQPGVAGTTVNVPSANPPRRPVSRLDEASDKRKAIAEERRAAAARGD